MFASRRPCPCPLAEQKSGRNFSYVSASNTTINTHRVNQTPKNVGHCPTPPSSTCPMKISAPGRGRRKGRLVCLILQAGKAGQRQHQDTSGQWQMQAQTRPLVTPSSHSQHLPSLWKRPNSTQQPQLHILSLLHWIFPLSRLFSEEKNLWRSLTAASFASTQGPERAKAAEFQSNSKQFALHLTFMRLLKDWRQRARWSCHPIRGKDNFPAKQTIRIQLAKIICSPRRDLGERLWGLAANSAKCSIFMAYVKELLCVLREVSICTNILDNKLTDVYPNLNQALMPKANHITNKIIKGMLLPVYYHIANPVSDQGLQNDLVLFQMVSFHCNFILALK